MGVWGAGLYSGDFALDLRSTIAAVARLPSDGEKICDILRQSEPDAAENAQNEEHTTFWLVLADQFHKRGIECAGATSRALNLIDSGADAAIHRELGMSPPNLRRRTKNLDDLRRRLREEPPGLRRAVLKKPQALILSVTFPSHAMGAIRTGIGGRKMPGLRRSSSIAASPLNTSPGIRSPLRSASSATSRR
jgi:hypothetical protein